MFTEENFTGDNFSFETMEQFYIVGKLKGDLLLCKEYVAKFFFPITNGSHIFIKNGKTNIIPDNTMKTVYLNRFRKEINEWYVKILLPRDIICDLHKPQVTKDYVNLAGRLIHTPQPYSEFSKDVKKSASYVRLYHVNLGK